MHYADLVLAIVGSV